MIGSNSSRTHRKALGEKKKVALLPNATQSPVETFLKRQWDAENSFLSLDLFNNCWILQQLTTGEWVVHLKIINGAGETNGPLCHSLPTVHSMQPPFCKYYMEHELDFFQVPEFDAHCTMCLSYLLYFQKVHFYLVEMNPFNLLNSLLICPPCK